MKRVVLYLFVLSAGSVPALAQNSAPPLPDAPQPAAERASAPVPAGYSPPTQAERFHAYVKGTFGVLPITEAVVRGGIQQARNRPDGWPQDGQGYADRFGSAMGQIAVRNTTEYMLSNLLREDLRCTRRAPSQSIFAAAFADTFTARRGADGHRVLSVARLAGPVAGTLVAYNTWYPAETDRGEVGAQIGLDFGVRLLGNVIRESLRH